MIITLYSSYSPDYLVGSLFYLVPAFLVLAWIAWRWPAQGGLLEIIVGIFWLANAGMSNWETVFFIPYAFLCGLLMAVGSLNIARGYTIKRKEFGS